MKTRKFSNQVSDVPLQESSRLSFSVRQTVISWCNPASCIIQTILFHSGSLKMRYPVEIKIQLSLCKYPQLFLTKKWNHSRVNDYSSFSFSLNFASEDMPSFCYNPKPATKVTHVEGNNYDHLSCMRMTKSVTCSKSRGVFST